MARSLITPPKTILDNIKYIHRDGCELRTEECGLCRDNWEHRIRIFDHESHIGEFDVYYCRRSGLGLTDPYPSEDTALYLYNTKNSADFDQSQGNFIEQLKDTLAEFQVKKMVKTSHLKNIRAVLDYATGNGRYAIACKKLFPSAVVDAVDYQPTPPPALEVIPTKVRYQYIEDFEGMDNRYDLIFLRHVLEHTHYPVKLLQFLGSLLSPNGILYLEVPNLESSCARILKQYWRGYYVPRHIFHYTRQSLQKLFEAADLTGDVFKAEQPMMGNTLALMTNTPVMRTRNIILGIPLYPLQLLIEYFSGSSSCLGAIVRNNTDDC